MIFHPRPGQRVRIHYAKHSASIMPHHGKVGIVRLVSHGPGPRNVGAKIGGQTVVVPRGNLMAPGRVQYGQPAGNPQQHRQQDAAGAKVYWDVADAEAKEDAEAGANKYLGKTVAATVDADTTVRVHLDQ